MLTLTALSSLGAARNAPALNTITQVLSAVSSASTITWPSGVQAGDLAVLLDFATSVGTPAAVTPTGFTQLTNQLISSRRLCANYKLCTGTETGSLTGMAGGSDNSKAMYIFRGNIAATLLTPSTWNQATNAGDPPSQTVLASGGVAPLVVFGCYGANSTINPRTFTVGGVGAKDGELQGSDNTNGCWLAYKIYNSAPADVVVDMANSGGANLLESGFIQMAA